MVPSVIRRDPRRLPPYCMRQQQPRPTTSVAAAIEAVTDEPQPITTDANNNANAHHGAQRSATDSPEFYIRGVVIGGKPKAEPSIDDPYQPIDSRQQRICDAVWRRRSHQGEASECDDKVDDDDDINDHECDDENNDAQRMDSSRIDELLMLDGYEMDRFGRLPGNSRTPTPLQRHGWTPDLAGNAERMSPRRPKRTNTAPPRMPSPTTEQIIRIVLSK